MKNKPEFWRYLKYIVFAICLLAVLIYVLRNDDLSVQTILELTPQNPILAAIVILLLYAIKSATVFFPLIILEIAVGHLFSTWVALAINLCGILTILTVPYRIGRTAGMDTIQKLIKKYPRFGEIIDRQQSNSLFLCFFLRIIGCLPGDVVTMYFGATRTPFWKNLVAGALGLLPKMILATLMGSSIQDPRSPAFWISAALIVTLAVVSALLYHLYRRKLQKNRSKK